MIYTYCSDDPGWRGGWRFVVLFHKGRKWIKLLDTATLEVYRRPVSETRRLRPYKMKPKTMARRLVQRRAAFQRHQVAFRTKAVRVAIDTLRRAGQ